MPEVYLLSGIDGEAALLGQQAGQAGADDPGAVHTKDGVLFNTGDLPEYASYAPQDCPLCRQGLEVDAVVDKYGYSKL